MNLTLSSRAGRSDAVRGDSSPRVGPHPIPPSPRKELNRLHLQHAQASPFLSGGAAGNPGTAEPAFQDSPVLLKGFPLEDLKTVTRNGGD